MNNTTSQYSPYAVINWIADAPLKARQKSVLLALARFMSKKNGYRVWPSQKLLCKKAGMSENTLRDQFQVLSDLGYVRFKFVPCNNGPGRYEYTLNVPSKTEGSQPQKLRVQPSKTEHKGDTRKGLDVDKKIEVPTERTTLSASAMENPENIPERISREKAEQICRNFEKACPSSASAREAFWHELGRLYFPDSPQFFPDHNLTHLQRKTMTRIFEDMPTTGCKVLAHIFKNWPSDGKYKAPNLSGLDEYSSTDLYQSWKQATDHETKKEMLKRVSAKLQAIESAQVTA